MAKDNKGEAKKTLVKNSSDMRPEEEEVNRSHEPGTTSRMKTGAKNLPGAFAKTGEKDSDEDTSDEKTSDEKAS